jgi:hypothetical protein
MSRRLTFASVVVCKSHDGTTVGYPENLFARAVGTLEANTPVNICQTLACHMRLALKTGNPSDRKRTDGPIGLRHSALPRTAVACIGVSNRSPGQSRPHQR